MTVSFNIWRKKAKSPDHQEFLVFEKKQLVIVLEQGVPIKQKKRKHVHVVVT